jgi:VanZ family protein
MALIFLASSSLLVDSMDFEATEEVFGSLNYFARKLAHIVEYAILAYLWLRSLCTAPDRFHRCLVWSILLTVVYAVTDEVHQAFVPQRLGLWSDVVFDAVGALCMGYVLRRIYREGSAELRRRVLGFAGDVEGPDPGGAAVK